MGQTDTVLTSSSATCDLGELLHAFGGNKACQQGGRADHMKSYIQAAATAPGQPQVVPSPLLIASSGHRSTLERLRDCFRGG